MTYDLDDTDAAEAMTPAEIAAQEARFVAAFVAVRPLVAAIPEGPDRMGPPIQPEEASRACRLRQGAKLGAAVAFAGMADGGSVLRVADAQVAWRLAEALARLHAGPPPLDRIMERMMTVEVAEAEAVAACWTDPAMIVAATAQLVSMLVAQEEA